MKKIRWQLIIIFLTGLIVGILLLSEQPGSLQTRVPEPARGGVYTEGLIGSMQRLNPLLDAFNSADRDINRLIYSGLVRFDDRGVAQPDLAESWGVSKDGLLYNFSLRPNVVWHDGEPLTSGDILFTVDLLRNGGDIIPNDIQTFWSKVEVKALSDDLIQFQLPEPYAPFLDFLSFGVLPQHLLDGISINDLIDSPFNVQPIGTGPYRFEQLIVDNDQINGVIIKIFDDFYGQKPFIEQLIFRYYDNSSSAYQAYTQGEIQGISEVTPDLLHEVLNNPDIGLYTGRKPELMMVLLNLNNPDVPFLQELLVRKALFQGVNRQWMVDRILGGQGIIADGPIMPGTWAHYDGLQITAYDSIEAIEKLKEAGYLLTDENDTTRKKDDVSLTLELVHPDTELHQLIAESIQSNWSELGIEVSLVPLPYEELVNLRLEPRSYQAALIDLNFTKSPDPDPYPFWNQAQATGGQNYSQWNNRVASEYLEQARINAELTERTRLYRNFQIVFNDELPSLPLYYPVYSYAVDREVQGVQIGPLFDTSDRFNSIHSWYLIARIPTPQVIE